MGSFDSDRSTGQSHQSTATAQKEDGDDNKTLGSVDITIQGRALTVRSDRDPEFVKQLADHVDQTLGELKNAAPGASNEKLLMMTSLTIAEELFEAQREADNLKQQVRERTEAMQDLLAQFEQQV